MTRKTEGGSAVPVFVVGGSGILTPEQSNWIDTASTDNPNPEQWVTADAKILSKSSEYTVQNADNAKIIECDGTFSVIFPDGLDTGFQVIVVNVVVGGMVEVDSQHGVVRDTVVCYLVGVGIVEEDSIAV